METKSYKKHRLRSKQKRPFYSIAQWLIFSLFYLTSLGSLNAQQCNGTTPCNASFPSGPISFDIELTGTSGTLNNATLSNTITPASGCNYPGGESIFTFLVFDVMPTDGALPASGTRNFNCSDAGMSFTRYIVLEELDAPNNGQYDMGCDATPIEVTVVVKDVAPPAITCPNNITMSVIDSCFLTLTPINPIPFHSDNCGPDTLSYVLSGATQGSATDTLGTTNFNDGLTIVTYSVTDTSSNVNTCSFTVTVNDNQLPQVSCPTDKMVNVSPDTCLALTVSDISMSSVSDNSSLSPGEYFECSPMVEFSLSGATTTTANVTSSNAGALSFNVGTTLVTYTVTDTEMTSSNTTTCTFNVTVIDNIAPTISCPSDTTLMNDAGECSANFIYTAPMGEDNCPASDTTIQIAGLPSGSNFPVGTTTNSFAVISPSGTPESFGPSDGSDGSLSNFDFTNGGPFSMEFDVNDTIYLESVTVFPRFNDPTLTVTVEDSDGDLVASKSFSVVFTSSTGPGLVLDLGFLLLPDDDYEISYTNSPATILRRNSDGASSFYNQTPTEAINITGNSVNDDDFWYYFFDWQVQSTQSEECSFVVTVEDTEAPVTADCPVDMSVSALLDDCEQVVSWTPPISFSDNCGIDTIAVEATDKNGNVIPLINTLPVGCDDAIDFTGIWSPGAWTPDLDGGDGSVTFSGTSSVEITGSDSNNDDTEVCITVPFNGLISFSYFSDLFGTPAEDAFVVLDGTEFNIGDGTGNDAGTLLFPIEQGTEICFRVESDGAGSEQGLTISNFFYTCSATQTTGTFPVGENEVAYYVTDIHNNVDTCSFSVTVTDDQDPTINCPADQTLASICEDALVPDYTDLANGFDICGLPTITQSPAAGTALKDVTLSSSGGLVDGAIFSMTFTATDSSSNTATCAIAITLDDQQDPIPNVASPLSNVIETACAGTYNHSAPKANSGCINSATIYGVPFPSPPGVSQGTDNTNYDFDPGTYTIIWRYTDVNGNFTEQVQFFDLTADTEVPTCSAMDITRNLDDTDGERNVLAEAIDDNSTDNCAIATYLIALDDGQDNFGTDLDLDCDDIGTVDVLLKVTDTSNNSAVACAATITVKDVDAPTFTCPQNGNFSSCGSRTISGTTYDLTGAIDNCGVASITNDQNGTSTLAGVSFGSGSTTVTWTVTDDSGNENSCTQTISVSQPSSGSSISCPPLNPTVNLSDDFNTADCSYSVGDLDPGEFNPSVSFGQCGGGSRPTHDYPAANFSGTYSSRSLDGALLPVGTTTIKWTNADGGSCLMNITVYDDVAPIVSCINNQTISLPLNGVLALENVVGLVSNSVDCSMVTLAISPDSLRCEDVGGPVAITVTATDANSNVATCNTTIEIQDNNNPVAICQSVTVNLDSDGVGTLVADSMDLASSDACGPLSFTISSDETDFSSIISMGCGDEGTSTIFFKATDDNGNEATTSCSVNVVDNSAPSAMCQLSFMVMLDADGDATIHVDSLDNGSSDACNNPVTLSYKVDVLSLGYASSHNFNCSDVTGSSSSYTATMRVVDSATPSNSNTCETTIMIGHAPPVARCTNYATDLDASGSASVVPANFNIGSDDVCGNTITMGIAEDTDNDGIPDGAFGTSLSYGCDDAGTHTIFFEVTDEFGKKDTCSSTLTINDDINPTVTCEAITVQLDNNGAAQINGSDILDAVSDNCDVIQLTPSQTQFDCSDIGANVITLTATDQNQNTGTCTAIVTVEDNVDPMAITRDIDVILDSSGNGSYNSFQIDDGSNDACGILDVSAAPTSFTCDDVGDNIVTLTVTDNNNNTATATATVTVIDNVDPIADCQMNITIDLDASGMVTVDADAVDDDSADACGGGDLNYSIAIDIDEDEVANEDEVFDGTLMLDCADIGMNHVILRVTDENNNTADCHSIITLQTVIENVAFTVGEVEGCETDIISVPVSVSNFQNMLGIQADFTVMDNTVATVLGVTDFNLTNLDLTDFTITGNTINLAWFQLNGTPITADNDDVIFNIEVELIGDPNMGDLTSNVTITNAILGQDLCGTLVAPSADITNGSIEINCEPNAVNLSGNVIKEGSTTPLNNVLITLSGDASATQTTDDTNSDPASYDFTVDAGMNYTITPTKDDILPNKTNINIIDLLTIQLDILGPFLPVHKRIAADVDDSGSINILDLFTIQALILGAPDFGSVGAWAFVTDDYVFANPMSPTPQSTFASSVTYNPANSDEDQTFLAIEMGDVTDDLPSTASETTPLTFFLEDQAVVAGQEYDLTFKANDFQNISGYQFTLEFDKEVLSYSNTTIGQLEDLSIDQFGLSQLNDGKLPALWFKNGGQSLMDNEELFTISFTALQDADRLSDLLSINTEDIEAFAFTTSMEKRDIAIEFSVTTSNDPTLEKGFKLYQNTPNPFINQTVIGFYLEQASQVDLTIINIAGKVVKRVKTTNPINGYQEMIIDHSDLEGSGVYFYRIETEQHTATRKMTLINH